MLVHLFGAVLSPSCAGFALRQVIKDNPTLASKEALDTVLRNFYVDDWLISVDEPVHAVRLAKEIRFLLSSRGFLLTKLSSNKEEVVESFPDEFMEDSMSNLDLDKATIQKTLGLVWDRSTDCFVFQTSIKQKPVNRRGILTMLSQIFDPTGFVHPFVLPMRILTQQLCSMKLSWDDPISASHATVWQE